MIEETKVKQLQSLFDDTKNISFGCVFFDLQQRENKSFPWPGSGWASIEGNKAYRIKGPEELSKDFIWLSNLKNDAWYQSNIFRQNHIKKSEYLKTDVGDIMKELQMIPQNLTIATITEQFSHMFNKIMRLAIELYKLNNFEKDDLITQLKDLFIGKDESLTIPVDEAFSRSYQDMVICEQINISLTGYKKIQLRRPRVIHAREILETEIPEKDSKWDLLLNEELPEKDNRLEYLLSLNRPFICKVKINDFKEQNMGNNRDMHLIDFNKLLNMGEAIGPKGVRKKRDWMTTTEIMYYSKFANLEIEAALIASSYSKTINKDKIPSFGDLLDMSYSYGILCECVWHSFADRSIDYINKSKTLVSPRATWYKAADRFYCLTAAILLASKGIQVLSYSSGIVNVLVSEEQIKSLLQIAPSAGLTVPIWLVEKYQLSKLIPG